MNDLVRDPEHLARLAGSLRRVEAELSSDHQSIAGQLRRSTGVGPLDAAIGDFLRSVARTSTDVCEELEGLGASLADTARTYTGLEANAAQRFSKGLQ